MPHLFHFPSFFFFFFSLPALVQHVAAVPPLPHAGGAVMKEDAADGWPLTVHKAVIGLIRRYLLVLVKPNGSARSPGCGNRCCSPQVAPTHDSPRRLLATVRESHFPELDREMSQLVCLAEEQMNPCSR